MWQLRPDQLEDLGKLVTTPYFINGNDPGTGKTPVTCVYQRWLWNEHGLGSIWPQPKSIMKKNRDEAYRFGLWENEDDVVIVDGTQKQVLNLLKKPARVWIMGFARFAQVWRLLPDYVRAFQADEFHKGFGGHTSGQTQAMYDFMRERGEWFAPITGTLINGSLDTAYPAIQVIEPRYYGTFDAFQRFHHVKDIWTGKRVDYKNHDHLRELMQLHGCYRKWTSIFGDEQKVIESEIVEMEDEQRVLYDKFERDAILELEKFYVDGTLPGVAFARARQIMEIPNHFPDLREPGSGKTVDIIPGRRPGKIERLDLHFTDHIENKTPFVVFAALIEQQLEIFHLAQSMGLRVGLINGAVSPKNRSRMDEMFIAGELQGLVVSPQCAELGFNWQFAGGQEVQHVIFASLY
jgi:hypothetical protein